MSEAIHPHVATCTKPDCATCDGPEALSYLAKPAPPEPYTEAEFEAMLQMVWNISDDDPYRFADLLAAALAFIAGIATTDPDSYFAGRAAGMLRRVEQRALWGPEVQS